MMRSLLTLGLAAAASSSAYATVATFDDVSLPAAGYYNGSTDSAGGFTSGGTRFTTNYNSSWGVWSGFAASNKVDATTVGFGNQYSVYAGAAASGTQFGLVFDSALATLPVGQRPESVVITNSTYTALDLQNGSGFSKKFGGPTGNDPDYFKVIFTSHLTDSPAAAAIGTVEFYLADFRFADNAQDYIVSEWTNVDLTGLGDARYVRVSFETTDVGGFGPNTPLYAAIDDFATVPEPASLAMLGLSAAGLLRRRR